MTMTDVRASQRATHPLPRVIGEDRWTDEQRPTVAGDVPNVGLVRYR